jgi:hypothetical protein
LIEFCGGLTHLPPNLLKEKTSRRLLFHMRHSREKTFGTVYSL